GHTKPVPASQNRNKPLVVEQESLQAIASSVDDQQAPRMREGIDPNHIRLDQIAAELTNLQVKASVFTVDVQHLAGRYAGHPLVLDKLRTGFKLAPDGMHLTDLVLQTSGSQLKGSIQLSYDAPASLVQAIDKVSMVAQLDKVKLAAEELGIFMPYFKQHHTAYTFSGKFVGQVNDFCVEDFQFRFGQAHSYLGGYASCQGLPNLQEALFNIQLKSSCLYTADLLPYVGEKHYKTLEQARFCQVQGNFAGSPRNFVAQGNFATGLGKITTKVEMAIDSSLQHTSYRGTIATDSLALGALLGTNTLQQLTMQGQIDGEGLSLATANFQLKADVHKLSFNNYEYEHIRTDGRFKQACFQGNLAIEDPNLQLQANTAIDWGRHKKEVCMKGALDKASLQALHITDKNVTLSTQLALTLQGTSLDDFTADAAFSQGCLDLAGKHVHIDNLHIRNGRHEDYSTLELTSYLLSIQAVGDLKYAALAHDIQQFIQGYQQRLTCSVPTTPNYTAQPYAFTYKVHFKDVNPLLYAFMPEVYISPNTTLAGSFSQDQEVALELHLATVDSLAFKQNSWASTRLDLTASQTKDGKRIAATGRLTAAKQSRGIHNTTANLLLDVAWNDDQVDFKNNLSHPDNLYQLNLQGKAILQDDAIKIKLNQTDIQVSGSQWNLHPGNLITLAKAQIRFQHIELYHEEQQVSLVGVLSPDLHEVLQLQLKDFALSNFNPLLVKELAGVVNGTVILQGTLDKLLIDSDVAIRDIAIGDLLVGDLQAKADWNSQARQLKIACQVTHLQRPTVRITGFYKPAELHNSLQLVADFSDAPLAMLEPFVEGQFSQLGGELNGQIHIQGSPANPQLRGNASITHGAIRINYLNTLYHCDGAITCAKDAIHINALSLADGQQGEGTLRGTIHHQAFQEFRLELIADVKNFKGLNTTDKDNEHFYGTGVISGSVALSGPVDRLAIDIKATTKPGTRFVIPIEQYGKQVAHAAYIRFVGPQAQESDTVAQARSVTLKGLALTIDLAVTSDACTEIILNKETGNAIKGKGQGNLTIKVDAEGALSMTGDYELIEGEYNFSAYTVLRKKFKILEKSSITWDGKPYEGILHVQAAYEQRVALAPLLSANSIVDRTYDKRRYPVQVVLVLQGALSAPESHFKVNFQESPDNPDLQAAIDSFQEKAAADERYLTNQAFSLVILKKFFSDNIAKSSRGTLGRSVSELLSQQLSSFSVQLDENLEIDTDIDEDGLESLRLRLAYNFLAKKLRIAREGEINIGSSNKINTT
ncbi:MAG: translocation/assembly module TamB domain-containing protein, partial [Bacteroidota bacterium]